MAAGHPRLERLEALSAFIDTTPYAEAAADYLQGDASTRSYARLVLPDRSAILMNSPSQPDGPPISDGKPYSALVHLAEDVTPFVAVGHELRRRGLAAPAIYAFDLERGFLIIEDLGDRVFGAEIARGIRRSAISTRLPWRFCSRIVARTVARPACRRGSCALPAAPLRRRTPCSPRPCCSLDWFWPALQWPADAGCRARRTMWTFGSLCLPGGRQADKTLVLRDFHSPNLMWLPERPRPATSRPARFSGRPSPGPPPTILCRSSRMRGSTCPKRLKPGFSLATVPPEQRERSAIFERSVFSLLYATLGAQRNSKILGIFARLAKRDGKRGYLAHIPRVARYLERNLAHPALAPLARLVRARAAAC